MKYIVEQCQRIEENATNNSLKKYYQGKMKMGQS